MATCISCGGPNDGPEAWCVACSRTYVEAGLASAGAEPLTAGKLELIPGDRVGEHLRVERKLGEGGMGVVFLAHDVALDRKVALKFLKPELADEEKVRRFEREARLTAKLDHPNVVPVFAVGRHGGLPFIVMKHLEGATLDARLRTKPAPLPQTEVLALMRQLCAGLQFIHERELVHRDIKPANIFVANDGHVTLLDFGIGRSTQDSGFTGLVGTVGYMAPEQLQGSFDHRTDLFALGLVLHELCTGRKGRFDSAAEPEVPPALAQVLRKATAAEPADRYPSARELLAALERAYLALESKPKRRRWAIAIALLGAGAAGAAYLAFTLPALRSGGGTPTPAAAARAPSGIAQRPGETTLGALPDRASPERSAPGAMADADGHRPQAAPAAPLERPNPGPTASPRDEVATATSNDALGRPAPASGAPSQGSPAGPHAPASPHEVAQAPSPTPSAAVSSSLSRKHSDKSAQSTSAHARGPGTLRVVTLFEGEPTWATLRVDGAVKGSTPLELRLAGGAHTLSLERQGFRRVERPVRIAPGKATALTVELHK